MRRIAALALLVGSTTASATWNYQEIHDDFDGKTSFLLQVESSIPVEGTDSQRHHPFLQLRCDEDGGQPYWRVHWFAIIGVSVSTNSIIGVVQNTRMQVRIDGKADNRMIWDWDRDESLEGISTYRVPAIIRALSGASELKLRIAGSYGKTHDATFDVSGLDAALEQLRPHCKRV